MAVTTITLTRPFSFCADMFDSNNFSDVHIFAGDEWQEIRAHRVILASGSEEFSRMFANTAETSSNNIVYYKFKRIHLYRAVELIYKGEIASPPEDDLPEFLQVCQALKIKGMPADLMSQYGLRTNDPNEPHNEGPAATPAGSPGNNDPSASGEPQSNGRPSGSSPSSSKSPSTSTAPASGTDVAVSLKTSTPVKRKLQPEFDAVSTSKTVLPIKSEPGTESLKKSRVSESGSGFKIKAELPDVKPGKGFIKSEAGIGGENPVQAMAVLAPDGDRTKCLLCAKTFATVGAGRTHVKEVHAEKPKEKFTCHVCSSVFSVPRYLQSHLQKKHQITKQMMKKAFK